MNSLKNKITEELLILQHCAIRQWPVTAPENTVSLIEPEERLDITLWILVRKKTVSRNFKKSKTDTSAKNSAFRNGKDIPEAKPQETQAGSQKDMELLDCVRDAI